MDIIRIAKRIADGFGENELHSEALLEGASALDKRLRADPVIIVSDFLNPPKALRKSPVAVAGLRNLHTSKLQVDAENAAKYYPVNRVNTENRPVVFDVSAVVTLARLLLKEIYARDEEIERLKGGEDYLKKKALAKLSKEEKVALGLEPNIEEIAAQLEEVVEQAENPTVLKIETVFDGTGRIQSILQTQLEKVTQLVHVFPNLSMGFVVHLGHKLTVSMQLALLSGSDGQEIFKEQQKKVEEEFFLFVALLVDELKARNWHIFGQLCPPSWIPLAVVDTTQQAILVWHPALHRPMGGSIEEARAALSSALQDVNLRHPFRHLNVTTFDEGESP